MVSIFSSFSISSDWLKDLSFFTNSRIRDLTLISFLPRRRKNSFSSFFNFFRTFSNDRPYLFTSLFHISFPLFIKFLSNSFFKKFLISLFALGVFTKLSQSGEGFLVGLVIISTISPLLSL